MPLAQPNHYMPSRLSLPALPIYRPRSRRHFDPVHEWRSSPNPSAGTSRGWFRLDTPGPEAFGCRSERQAQILSGPPQGVVVERHCGTRRYGTFPIRVQGQVVHIQLGREAAIWIRIVGDWSRGPGAEERERRVAACLEFGVARGEILVQIGDSPTVTPEARDDERDGGVRDIGIGRSGESGEDRDVDGWNELGRAGFEMYMIYSTHHLQDCSRVRCCCYCFRRHRAHIAPGRFG